MEVSRMSALCYLFILTILFIQASANLHLSTTSKKWVDYIWSTPTTTAVDHPYFTGVAIDGKHTSLSPQKWEVLYTQDPVAIKDLATSEPILNPKQGGPHSTFKNWLALAHYRAFNLNIFNRNNHASDLQRRLDCAISQLAIDKYARNPDVECGYNLFKYLEQHAMKHCEDFEETLGLSQPYLTEDELPINSTALEGFRVGNLKQIAAQMPHHIECIVDIYKKIVLTLAPTIFLLAMLAAYHNGDGFQPLKATKVVLKVFCLYGLFTYSRQKMLRLCQVFHVWDLCWSFKKQKKDNDTVAIPAQEWTARKALVQRWLRSLKNNSEENPALADDREWLVVDRDDAGSSSEEDARARRR